MGVTGKITRKFQVTIPNVFVEELGLQEGDSILFELEKGRVVIIPLVPAGESPAWLKKRKTKTQVTQKRKRGGK